MNHIFFFLYPVHLCALRTSFVPVLLIRSLWENSYFVLLAFASKRGRHHLTCVIYKDQPIQAFHSYWARDMRYALFSWNFSVRIYFTIGSEYESNGMGILYCILSDWYFNSCSLIVSCGQMLSVCKNISLHRYFITVFKDKTLLSYIRDDELDEISNKISKSG